ncbi:MAG: hypothetical protein HY282_02400 [Nitrospirae bacterium]|nr:hypothetical protein [Candidatus Manganitrophaceae bacterium]
MNRGRAFYRGAFLLVLIYYAWILLVRQVPTVETFYHLVDLPFHEAGHVLFRIGGEFLTILGGSLFQVIMPSIVFGHFFRRKDYFGAAVVLFWVGENFLDVSAYIGDARAMQLQLLGCEEPPCEGHDWNNILDRLGMLKWDTALARFIFGLGAILMLGSIGYGLWLFWKDWTGDEAVLRKSDRSGVQP